MASILGAYDRALQRRPILVKTVTSAVLFGLGDVMSQKLEGKESLDVARTARLTAWGGMFAPLAHVWYGALDKMIPGQGAIVVAKKVAADQLTWTIAINCAFFWATTVMETGDSMKGVQKIQDKLWPTLKVNWVVWPVLQGINMSMVPLQYRLLFVNFCSLGWSAFLSGQTASGAPAPEGAAAAAAPAVVKALKDADAAAAGKQDKA